MTSADGGITWTGTFTPDVGIEDATNLISLATSYTDIAGNTGSIASSGNYSVDTLAPAAVALDLAAADDNGASNSDNITSQTTNLTISGVAEAGSTVDLFEDIDDDGIIDGGESFGSFSAAAFAAGVDISLTAGSVHYIKAIVTDAAGNVGAASANLDISIAALGFAITGELANDQSGFSVSGAGDVNGDGLADLIIGADQNAAGGADAGRSYVVWGKADGTAVNLDDVVLGTGGFVITGETTTDESGYSLSAAGDVNGDGLADIIIGAYASDAGGVNFGRSYVVWGKADGTAVNLDDVVLGTGGFVITGEAVGDLSGYRRLSQRVSMPLSGLVEIKDLIGKLEAALAENKPN